VFFFPNSKKSAFPSAIISGLHSCKLKKKQEEKRKVQEMAEVNVPRGTGDDVAYVGRWEG
jgi:hypothetical protein